MTEHVLTSRSVEDYFHTALHGALANQQIEAGAETVRYVVHMLGVFARSDRLYRHSEDGYGLKPLAMLYADAAYASSPTQRNEALRHLGDVALFIAGLFSQSLNRKLVDVDYYVAMGGGAYGELSSTLSQARAGAALSHVFAELSVKFSDFVDALAEVGEDAHFTRDRDLLRSYELWVRTGSRREAARLRRAGIQPSEAAISRSEH